MLATSCYIFNPASIGGDQYTIELYLNPATSAKFVRIGDVITDTNTNTYAVINPTALPLSDGDTVTVQATGANVLPQLDSDYDSIIETPGQVDSRAPVATPGTIDSASLAVSHEFTYLISASWDITADANSSEIGDRMIDSTGKEYEIVSFTSPGLKWGDTVTVAEVEKVGNTPDIGKAALYRPTSNYALFQGSHITDAAMGVAKARDNFFLDSIIDGLSLGGGSSNGEWQQYHHTITAGEETAKAFDLPLAPATPSEVDIDISGAPDGFIYGDDFTISGATFSWSGLSLDGLLAEGDVVTFHYFS